MYHIRKQPNKEEYCIYGKNGKLKYKTTRRDLARRKLKSLLKQFWVNNNGSMENPSPISFGESRMRTLKCSPKNYQCGGRCQNSKRNCPSNKDKSAQEAAQKMSDLIQRVATGKGTKKDKKRVEDNPELSKAVKKEKKSIEKAKQSVEKATEEKELESAAKEVSQAEKDVKKLVDDFDKDISAIQDLANPKRKKAETKEEILQESLDILDMLDEYDAMMESVQDNPGVLAIRENSGLTRQNKEESKQPKSEQRQLPSNYVIDVKATTVSNRTSTNAEVKNEQLRRKANQLSDVAKTLFNAATPTPKEGQTKGQAIVGSLGRNAARAQAGAKIAGVAGRRAVADTKTVIDAIDRFRRNRRK